MGYLCTCARAHRTSASQERLDRLCSNWHVGWRSLSTCFPQVMGGVGHLCTCARAPPSPYLRIRVANCAKIWCVARDPKVTRFTRVGGGVTTFARACPVSLSRKPLSPGIEATPKTDLSLSRSLVHRQTWRLTGFVKVNAGITYILVHVLLRRGHSDWSASSGQPSYYFLWPAASGRARTECDIVLISLWWKNVCT